MQFVDIKNMEAENLNVIPQNIDDEGLKEAYQDANKHSWEKAELEAYDYAAMREQDERGKVELAEKRGKNKMQIEAILGFNRIGLSVDKIAEAMNISIEHANEIIENHSNKA